MEWFLEQLTSMQLTSFGDVVEIVFKRVSTRKGAYFVTDQYKPGSIKSLEREKRKPFDCMIQVRIERREEQRLK